MLTLAWGLFLLVLLAGAGAVLAALLDCDAALLPLPLLSAAALVLYPFGMLGNLRIGAAAAVLLLGAAVVVGVVRLRPAGVGTAENRPDPPRLCTVFGWCCVYLVPVCPAPAHVYPVGRVHRLGPCAQNGGGARRVLCGRSRQPESQLYLPGHQPGDVLVPALWFVG